MADRAETYIIRAGNLPIRARTGHVTKTKNGSKPAFIKQ